MEKKFNSYFKFKNASFVKFNSNVIFILTICFIFLFAKVKTNKEQSTYYKLIKKWNFTTKVNNHYELTELFDHTHVYEPYVSNNLTLQNEINEINDIKKANSANKIQQLFKFIESDNSIQTNKNTNSLVSRLKYDFHESKIAEAAIVSYNQNINKQEKDCSSLFTNCLCSFHEETKRNFLYCNDQAVKEIPDFKKIYNLFDRDIKTKYPNLNLIFSKVDFSGSHINFIKKNDLKYLQMDLFNSKIFISKNNSMIKTNIDNQSISISTTTPEVHSNSFESYLEHLKKTIVPIYHLDFDNILNIDDGAFEEFLITSTQLTYELAFPNNTNFNRNGKIDQNMDILLKIRFSNSRFNFSPSRKPFKGLKAQEFHIKSMPNEYLCNSIFDESIILELFIEDTPEFIGFLDLSSDLPNGKLLNRFIAIRSYKIDSLCSHSLPSFVDQETFNEIIIKKCSNLRSIKEFTFYKYPHLKSLVLAANNFSKINKNAFRYLKELEVLDLSSNPIATIEDNTFIDLYSLRRLFLESTMIKEIMSNTLNGLSNLNELRLTKSYNLKNIEHNAFNHFKNTLKELHLKDTQVKLIDKILNDGIEPPYESHKNINTTNKVWIDGLELKLLNIDSSVNSEEFSFNKYDNASKNNLMCKIIRYIPSTTLINLQRNQSCNCLIYLIYRRKNFDLYQNNWEFKTPFCYRSQIKYDEKRFKSFNDILKHEIECGINSLNEFCFPTTTTSTTTTTTTTTTTSTTTTTVRTTIKTKKSFHTTRPTRKLNPTSSQISQENIKATPKFPKLDFKKLIKVTATILGISAFSIILTIVGLKLSKILEKRKKESKLQNMRQRTSSNSSSTQTNLNNQSFLSNTKRKTIMMPPSLIPPFNNKTTNKRQNSTINQLVSNQYMNQYKNETSMLINQTNSSENPTASFTINEN